VLEYRDPHGIKIEIGDHKSSWKEVGQEVVDELVERGGPRHADFNNLVVIRTDQDSKLQYCFERSIRNQVDTDLLSIDIKGSDENQPIWGFSDGDLWKILSKRDGLLFSTEPGVFTHYVSIGQTIEDRNVMTKLWIEYEDGVRSGGIDEPWPYLALGTDVQEIQLREETVSEKLGIELSDTPVQLFDEEDLSEFLHSYGGFGSFLREQERRASQVASGGNQEFEAEPHTIEALLDLPWDDLPLEKDPTLEETRRKKRKNAFQKGIYQIYSGCAVCGRLTESPSGNADLEAAHIVPKSADGPDVLQNGIGLCSRHHWAFDNGWFEFDENYQIEVKGTPDLKGYEEFEQYDGIRLQVPSEMRLRPHPQYIRQRFGTK
jgi:predicted restriction endonuclease